MPKRAAPFLSRKYCNASRHAGRASLLKIRQRTWRLAGFAVAPTVAPTSTFDKALFEEHEQGTRRGSAWGNAAGYSAYLPLSRFPEADSQGACAV